MVLRRGFKAEAERISACIRREMHLEEADPICPWKVAKHLEYQVADLSKFAEELPEEVALLRKYTGPKGFSAVTIFAERAPRYVILNDGHSEKRRAADLAHELAHGLLLHPSECMSPEGRTNVDKMHEEEANWLGPTILVPRAAARSIVRRQLSVAVAADQYGVSEELMELRLRVTGVRKIGA